MRHKSALDGVAPWIGVVATTIVTIAFNAPSGIALVALLGLVLRVARRDGRKRAGELAMWSTAAFVAIANPRAPAHDRGVAAVELAAMAVLLSTALIGSSQRGHGVRRLEGPIPMPPDDGPAEAEPVEKSAALAG